jgi:hypothetical protein
MLRIIGDVHAQRGAYLRATVEANNAGIQTLQVGDLGFKYDYKRLLASGLNTQDNKFFMGNHDDYDFCQAGDARFDEYNLGDYGMIHHGGLDFFFVRGAFSIDIGFRTQGIDWWPEEELAYSQFDELMAAYVAAKPGLVVTHECPTLVGHDGVLKTDRILKDFGWNPATFDTRTGVMLQKLFDAHQPNMWVFGHYHQSWRSVVQGCQFICLPILGYVDVEANDS